MTTPSADDAVQVRLPDDKTAPSVARAKTRTVLGGWRQGALLEPLLLVVSELVGNAVRHGRPPVQMLLRRAGRGVVVEVHDEASASAPTPPTLPDSEAESGRGMYLVDAMSADSGVEDIDGDGKVVWARLEPDSDPSPLS